MRSISKEAIGNTIQLQIWYLLRCVEKMIGKALIKIIQESVGVLTLYLWNTLRNITA
jgi:hypothetical protein